MIRAHPSWLLDEPLEPLPPVHTLPGIHAPTSAGRYHIEFAELELARPLLYYEQRVAAVGLTGHERVLDVGCGIGQWCVALARANAEVHGVDRVPERLAIGEALARRQRRLVHFTHGDAEQLPYADGFFDGVVCYGVFMFLDPERAMSELARVLRPGGTLYLSANGLGWSLKLMLQRRLWSTGWTTIKRTLRGEAPDNFLTRRRMRRLLHAHGLELERWGGEGTLRVAAPPPEPVYPSRYLGVTCVWELLARKHRSAAPTRAPDNVAADAERLAARGRAFETLEARVPATVRRVEQRSPVTEEDYGAELIASARAQSPSDPDSWLDGLAAELTAGAESEDDAVVRVIRFLQDAFFHHPVRQPPVDLPVHELLQLGEGRCGHVVRTAADLLRRAGFSARGRQLPRHIAAEVYLDGEWRLVDADAYKNGVVPRARDGHLLSMRDLEENPYQLDRFPATGLWVRRGTRYARNEAGEDVEGYVDAIDPEERGYMSAHYAAWAAPEHPPSVPRELRAAVEGRRVRLSWAPSTDRDGDLRRYRIRVGTTSKGWSFDNAVYDRLLGETGAEVGRFDVDEPAFELELDEPGTYFWSVQAVDGHVDREAETFYWSSDEGGFDVS